VKEQSYCVEASIFGVDRISKICQEAREEQFSLDSDQSLRRLREFNVQKEVETNPGEQKPMSITILQEIKTGRLKLFKSHIRPDREEQCVLYA
jgi:hypothetical protein